MIAVASMPGQQPIPQQAVERFESMLPAIVDVARYAHRKVPRRRREELVADVVAKAYEGYVALVRQGRGSLAYPSPLGRYAIKQIGCGREFGVRQNSKEVLSDLAQKQRGFTVLPLVRRSRDGEWEEVLVEDRRSTPADIAATRLDFTAWLQRLKRFQRRLALHLASGHRPSELAEQLRLSRARLSQLRRELHANWLDFQGESAPAAA